MNPLKVTATIYIEGTPEGVWAALTQPEITRLYWSGMSIESDWYVGSRVIYQQDGDITDDGIVLKADFPNILSYTFQSKRAEFCDEAPSRVKFSINGENGVVRLTVTHDNFMPQSKLYLAGQDCWPMILSGLKTLLETGRPLANFGLCHQKSPVAELVY
jgi:uncharacterized protein YndB with AHSA1/START domain